MLIVLGSRNYQPLTDVDAMDWASEDVVTFGESAVALRAEMRGARRGRLDSSRASLLQAATEDRSRTLLFCCRDPTTKQVSSGMAGIQTLLRERELPFEVISSPFPAAVCAVLTSADQWIARTKTAAMPWQAKNALARTLTVNRDLAVERSKYEQKMNEGMHVGVGETELDDRWIRWLRIYEQLSDRMTEISGFLRTVAA